MMVNVQCTNVNGRCPRKRPELIPANSRAFVDIFHEILVNCRLWLLTCLFTSQMGIPQFIDSGCSLKLIYSMEEPMRLQGGADLLKFLGHQADSIGSIFDNFFHYFKCLT